MIVDVIMWCVGALALGSAGFGLWQRGQHEARQAAEDEVQALIDRATLAKAKRELIKARVG